MSFEGPKSAPDIKKQIDTLAPKLSAPAEVNAAFRESVRVPIKTIAGSRQTVLEQAVAPKAEVGVLGKLKEMGGAIAERARSSLDGIANRFIASNSVRGLGSEIDGLKRQIETLDKDALAADARGDRTQTIALRTKQMEALASINTKAKERSTFARELQTHYESKLTAPREDRKRWGEKFQEANIAYSKYERINLERRALFEGSNAQFSALIKSGVPKDSEDMKKVLAQLQLLDTQMKQGEEAMSLAKKQMDEHANKIEKWDSKNTKVMAKVNRWKNISENGKHGTSVESLSRQGAIEAANNVTVLPSRGGAEVAKKPEATTPATPPEAVPTTMEVPEKLTEEELITALADLLNQPEEFDFDKELKKLVDSDLGKFIQMARPNRNLADSWNRLAKVDKRYEQITEEQRVRLSTNADGNMSIIDFGKQLKEQFKKKPEMVIAGMTMMARALKERPKSLAA